MESHHLSPSMQPTELPFSKENRIAQSITAESLSLLNRSIICYICVTRLYGYKKAGMLNFNELKCQFHFIMLLSVPFCMPYFAFCLVRYETWQCYANHMDTPANIYRATWTFYSIYRIGLSFQLACLSLTVLQWSNFLSYSERIGRVAQIASDRHTRLIKILVIVNLFGILGSIVLNVMVMSEPERAENGSGQESLFLYMNWYYLDFVQLALVIFLMNMGNRMLQRLRDSVMLNETNKKLVLRKLNIVLFLIIICIFIEVLSRIILSMPGFVGESKWENKPQPWYDMRHFLENQTIIWQFVGYILPYDAVCFCLLYLMRAPMKQQAVFSATHDDDEDMENNNESDDETFAANHQSTTTQSSSISHSNTSHSNHHYNNDHDKNNHSGGQIHGSRNKNNNSSTSSNYTGTGYDRFFEPNETQHYHGNTQTTLSHHMDGHSSLRNVSYVVEDEIIGIRPSSSSSLVSSSLVNPLLNELDHIENSPIDDDHNALS
mmetsp:Transcript_33892/g.43707  ORF Transcript_33892/g.43707 Transcript_33892/m.43707 type:complete len:491 (-) Transcript_33892:159-1631(-)